MVNSHLGNQISIGCQFLSVEVHEHKLFFCSLVKYTCYKKVYMYMLIYHTGNTMIATSQPLVSKAVNMDSPF